MNSNKRYDFLQTENRMVLGGSRRHHHTLFADDAPLQLYAYRSTNFRTFLFVALSLATCGLFRLVMHWKPKWLVRFRAVRSTFDDADLVLIVDSHNVSEICKVRSRSARASQPTVVATEDGSLTELKELRWFVYRKQQFTWIENEWSTAALCYSKISPQKLIDSVDRGGLSSDEAELRRTYFGENLMAADLTPIFVIICKEIISPFYMFQIFSVIVWYIDEYVWYATLIVAMTLCSIIATIASTRKQEKRIRSMVRQRETVQVLRDGGNIKTLDSTEVVPGDILVVPAQGGVLQCDCVLLNGAAIVNESMLTGESIPITKVALTDDGHDEFFSITKHNKSVMYCGTQVLQTRFYKGQHVKALVLRTAYSTVKGQLVRSIMYPKPVDFRFITDLFKFIGVLSIVASFGFFYTAVVLVARGSTIFRVLIRALDLVTIVVPPALPAVMSVGILYAQSRLKAKEIFCISPSTINTCGAINVVCFDKTGTLTEDGLDFHAVRMIERREDEEVDDSKEHLFFGDEVTALSVSENCREMVRAIATCHSLTRINGELHGDPLDMILFEQTGFSLEEGDEDDSQNFDVQPTFVCPPRGSSVHTECSVVRQFTFSSTLQRMSVIVANPTNHSTMVVYCKGSPEMVMSLCRPETVPDDFHDVVDEYTQHGYRLIAVATKPLDVSLINANKVTRNAVECDLSMIGLIALENRLKPVTEDVIDRLNKANIRSVMVTGDNLLTALSVARECGIIRPSKRAFLIEHRNDAKDHRNRTSLSVKQAAHEGHVTMINGAKINESKKIEDSSDLSRLCGAQTQFAISGPTFAVVVHEYPELVEQLVCVCDVFARMAPDQKQMLVEQLQLVDYTVAMCGDGANDCAALKAAHAGISLSDSEASIAAPFTSKVPDIRCVPTIISEGRAALMTSFGTFLYMSGYSLTQFISILYLYWISNSFTQTQFLFIDLCIITLLAVLFGKTKAYPRLAAKPPPARILSISSMVSLFGQLIIGGIAQLIVFNLVALQPWFVPYDPPTGDGPEDRRSMQGTAIFYVSVFQYIVLAGIYSKGPPYRSSILSNRPLCLAIVLDVVLCLWIVIAPNVFFMRLLGCVDLPSLQFRLLIVLVASIAAFCSYIFDRFHDQAVRLALDRWRRTRKSGFCN
ncbi:unnamed protein product [Caenorhabditis auriculariae]|uniref:Cation-transporting ATPase n=1 Tax=Caenorhabditis auriculariae TaxID=2777116 RepID=A0A8S1HF75_9PELO|nr:unnamed protein product [Caenorhabditis auriculariae]